MIKANELRIGNWVLFNGRPVCIRELEHDSRVDVYLDTGVNIATYKPIPLTEEILLKCGFKDGELFYGNGGASIYIVNGFAYLYPEVNKKLTVDMKHAPIDENMKYLHQLQNLYFVLTGKELEVKL